jgi:hypothetical protein
VSAPMKRRRPPVYLSLPCVILVVFLIVVKLVAMQRADIIGELADRVAHSDTPEATAAVRQLAAMPRPPVAILVEASASDDRAVADEAQLAITKMLRRSDRLLAADRGTKSIGRQMENLAQALVVHRAAFAGNDRKWLAATTQQILELSNQLAPKHTPLLAQQCDIILEGLDSAPSEIQRSARNLDRKIPESIRTHELATSEPSSEAGVGSDALTDGKEDNPLRDSLDASWRAGWTSPVFRTLPATPNETKPTEPPATPESFAPMPEHEPERLEILDQPLARVETRTLLQRWIAADRITRSALDLELRQRGFGRVTETLVQSLLSNAPDDRLQLADDVLSTPGVNAKPWLVLLADDRDADVRLAAVTIMATSNDPALVEKAWQAAIHDRDPRIAALAERLRERRSATRRR